MKKLWNTNVGGNVWLIPAVSLLLKHDGADEYVMDALAWKALQGLHTVILHGGQVFLE